MAQISKKLKTRVNLIKLIEVFDECDNAYKGHTTPIIGFIGEDLNAAIFHDYLIRRKKVTDVKILPYKVTEKRGLVRGRELDRWIKANKTLYQTEIKNWCCFQIGGYKLLLSDSTEKVKKLANEKWKKELSGQYNNIKEFGKVSKVLAKMKIPNDLVKKHNTVKPLVIHWMPISKKEAMSFFSHPVKDLGMNRNFTKQIQEDFSEVNYFSCSLYIRELINEGKKELNLNLPNVDVRTNIIKNLMK